MTANVITMVIILLECFLSKNKERRSARIINKSDMLISIKNIPGKKPVWNKSAFSEKLVESI